MPSPAGFVVKKGLKIFSLTSGGMPVPLSQILISTLSPRFLVAAARIGSLPPIPARCAPARDFANEPNHEPLQRHDNLAVILRRHDRQRPRGL